MDKTIVIILAAVLALGVSFFAISNQQESVGPVAWEMVLPEEPREADLDQNLFFITYNVYDVVFDLFELVDRISYEDKLTILQNLYQYLDYEETVTLLVDTGERIPLVISFELAVDEEDGQTKLLMATNYDYKKGKVQRELDWERAFTTYFVLSDNKLTHPGLMESEDLVQEAREAGILNDVAHIYLFDELPENDQYIEELLFEYIETAEKASSRFIGVITLLEYYASIDEMELVEERFLEAEEKLFADATLSSEERLLNVLLKTREIIDLTKAMRNKFDTN